MMTCNGLIMAWCAIELWRNRGWLELLMLVRWRLYCLWLLNFCVSMSQHEFGISCKRQEWNESESASVRLAWLQRRSCACSLASRLVRHQVASFEPEASVQNGL